MGKVEYDDVWPQCAIHRHAEFSIAGLSYNANLGMPGENRVEGHAREEVVLYKKNADLLHIPIQRMT